MRQAPWLEDFENELLAFHIARFDNQVDALSQLLERVRKKGTFSGSPSAEPEVPDPNFDPFLSE